MSFEQLNNLEAQPAAGDTHRRGDDPQYRDDPEFDRLTETLSNQLFTLTSNISRLSTQISLLGTKRDNERVRERVHDLLESSRSGFKDVGDGIKKVQGWEDVSVCRSSSILPVGLKQILTVMILAFAEVDTTEAVFRLQNYLGRIPGRPAPRSGKATRVSSCCANSSSRS